MRIKKDTTESWIPDETRRWGELVGERDSWSRCLLNSFEGGGGVEDGMVFGDVQSLMGIRVSRADPGVLVVFGG